jgi:DNA-binding NarL/FixJ family response regulator
VIIFVSFKKLGSFPKTPQNNWITMNIVFFDDHESMLDSLDNYFSNVANCRVVGKMKKSFELLSFFDNTEDVDTIIMDLLTEEELGTGLIGAVRKKVPDLQIVVYSSASLDIIKDSCIEVGADLYVTKTTSIDNLHRLIIENTIQKYANGKKKIEYKISPQLTKKERQIVNEIINGLSSNEIALKLDCSPYTINNQKNHLISKFKCRTSTELVVKLIRMGYIKI